MTRKASTAHSAIRSPRALCPHLGLRPAAPGSGLEAPLSLARWLLEHGELIRPSPPQPGQDPATIKSGCIDQSSLYSFLETGLGCQAGERSPADVHPLSLVGNLPESQVSNRADTRWDGKQQIDGTEKLTDSWAGQ